MFILDPDTVTLATHYASSNSSLVGRISAQPTDSIYTTVISVDEILQGVMALIRRRQDSPGSVSANWRINKLLRFACDISLLAFDEASYAIFSSFPASVKRRGPNDCRIAAIDISSGMTVITRNSPDFDRIPGVKHEDWTR